MSFAIFLTTLADDAFESVGYFLESVDQDSTDELQWAWCDELQYRADTTDLVDLLLTDTEWTC